MDDTLETVPQRPSHQRLLAACLVALVIGTATGCAPDASRHDDSSFTDDLGRTVTTPDTVQRVLTLAPNLTEIVFAAGAGSRLAAASTADDFPPSIDTLPRFSPQPVDFEKIAALEPDLVLATDQVNNPQDAETFSSLDIPVAFFSFDEVQDVFRVTREVGTLLNTSTKARRAADSLEAAFDALKQKTASVSRRPRVLFLIGDRTLYAFGADSYVHTLIRAAGGQSVTSDLQTQAPVLSEEYVLREKPDVIIGAFGAEYDPDRLLKFHPTWKAVPAVKNDRVYSLNGNLILRPGPRLVRGARRMASLLHPELFPASDSATQRAPAS